MATEPIIKPAPAVAIKQKANTGREGCPGTPGHYAGTARFLNSSRLHLSRDIVPVWQGHFS
ncbi:MAG TPA: hypothetical protein VH186_09225 [Chloroflexia bacterium]|nr:hypothetical protein [Chloroflexia bacterium]